MTNNYHYFGMTNDQLIEQVCDFIFNPKNNFNGVIRCGQYNIGKTVFRDALLEYLKTGKNTLDEYDKFVWQRWENVERNVMGAISVLSQEDILFFEQALQQTNYWNIYAIYSDEDIVKLKENIEFSKSYWGRKNSRKQKRIDACTFTCKATIRTQVFERDGKQCKFCKTDQNLTLDHIIPITKGGVNEIDNLQVLCRSCNSKKSNKI